MLLPLIPAALRRHSAVRALTLLPLLLLTAPSLLPAVGQAALTETWVHEDEPTWPTVAAWKTFTHPKNLRLHLTYPPTRDLLAKLKEGGFEKIQVTSPEYPLASSVDRWKELADHKIEFVYLGGALPTAGHVKVLNEIRFPRMLFVLGRYIEYQEKTAFHGIEPDLKYDIHFALNRYPQFLHKFPIAELPPGVGIQISVDYWPRYVQMDILNMIPQAKKLRIRDTPLSTGAVTYTQHLENIQEIIFDSDFEPAFSQWTTLEQFPLQWQLKIITPSAEHLEKLRTWAAKDGVRFRLTLDPDRRPTDGEQKLYNELPFEVEWTADAP